MTNTDLTKTYLKHLTNDKSASSWTFKSYSYDILHFLNFIGSKELLMVSTDDVKNYAAYLKQSRGLANASINRKMISLRSMFRFFKHTRFLSENPFDVYVYLKQKHAPLSVLTQDQVIKIIHHFDKTVESSKAHPNRNLITALRNRLIFKMMIFGGFRRSEIIGLRVFDLVKAGSRSWMFKVQGRNTMARAVPLHPSLYENIAEYLKTRSSASEYLFLRAQSAKPISIYTIHYLFKEINLRIPLKMRISPRVLRSTFAANLAHNGENIKTIQDLLGHVLLETTQRYLPTPMTSRQQAINKLSAGI
jgi:site-specific recombinase XerD